MSQKILLYCGIFSPVLYALSDLIAGLQWDAYSFRDQTISELGAIGAPTQPLFSALLIPTYLLLTAFGVGIWKTAGERRHLRTAGLLVIILGVMALTVGQFVPMRPRGTEQGLSGALHLIEGGVAMVLVLSAMGFAAAALDKKFVIYTVVSVILVLLFGGWSAMDAPAVEAGRPTPWLGIRERLFWYAYQLWFAVLALKLLREQKRHPKPA